MTKQEIEKAIENGESVWVALDDKVERLARLKWFTDDIVMDRGLSHIITRNYFNHLYKTKAEAEHYLHHANISRTEHLPFLTWEEFKEKKEMYFLGYDRNVYKLLIYEAWIWLENAKYFEMVDRWSLSESNFYKAYDECVRLFRGEE